MRNKFLFNLIILAFIFSQCKRETQPNFLFILVDDLGWTDVECNNPNTFYETKNINQLAEEGILFTNGYASCPVCSPSRASIMTGKYPARLNITDWIPGLDPKNRKLLGPQDLHNLPLEEKTIAEVLQENGYKTGFFGKWHLGETEKFWPENQGFNVNIGGWSKGSPASYYSPYKNPKIQDGTEGEYLPDRLTNETIKFIEANKDQPFFASLSFYTVHTPIQASNKHIDYYNNKKKHFNFDSLAFRIEHEGLTDLLQNNTSYASMVHAMDENVGRLLKKLKDLKLFENTVVIFTSDNGGLSTKINGENPTSNEPLRAGKGWCYEGGIRVPLIIKPVGAYDAGKISNIMVTSTDFYPTILDFANINLMPENHADGVSIHSYITKNLAPERKTLFWHYPHYHGSTWTPGAAIRHKDWKLIVFYDYEKIELFDLKNDPSEKIDLAQLKPEKVKELKVMLEQWQKSVKAQMPAKNPNYNSVKK